MKGVLEHLRSDNGPKFVAKDLRKWLAKTGAKTLYIEPGPPRGDRLLRKLQLKLRDEFLNGEIFYSIKELRVLAERWRVHYNTIKPHSSLAIDRRHPRRSWHLLLGRKLDKYQQDAYRNLLSIAGEYNGAFLCDAVGLGKTYVGLMLL